jgi:hypothetical protein
VTVALDHAPARIVQQLLVDLSLGTLPEDDDDWPIYRDIEPDGADVPDSVITVYTTAGRMEASDFLGARSERHGVQVRIRDASPDDGYTKANDIAEAMDETVTYDTVTIGSSVYLVFVLHRAGAVIPLGRHTPHSNRCLFTINAYLVVRQTT